MLSATPVNNRFRDLQNQLELAYGDKGDEWSRKLGLSTNIDMVFRNAQKLTVSGRNSNRRNATPNV